MSRVPTIRVREITFFVLPTATRFPFRYGIAAMTEAPHLFVHSTIEIDGRPVPGIASEGLPPKWFTKNPDTTFEKDDLPGMQRVIGQAAVFAIEITEALSFFDFWRTLKARHDHWSRTQPFPPLLAQLGTALIERSVLDGLCRGLGQPLHKVVKSNRLGIELGAIHPELAGTGLSKVFRAPPLTTLRARHTIGLADPLTDADIPASDRIDDGLPQSLISNIRAYGLTHFKVKLGGNLETDRDRLRNLAALFASEAPPDYMITIDGNEQYSDIGTFREAWLSHRSDRAIAPLFEHLLFVEQPLHRDTALLDSVRTGFENWRDAPPVIIDESDSGLECLPRALDLGYAGTSHKNCKGIVKSIANRALIDRRGAIMSAEDLANLGPIALQQDLAMVALLGIDHVERNGHHYFAGLSQFPKAIQQATLNAHPDLYHASRDGFPTLTIRNGLINTTTVNNSPFGLNLDPSDFKDIGIPE